MNECEQSKKYSFADVLENVLNNATFNKFCIFLGVLLIYFAANRFHEENYFNCFADVVISITIIFNNGMRLYKNRNQS